MGLNVLMLSYLFDLLTSAVYFNLLKNELICT